jgi:hypothetical protein
MQRRRRFTPTVDAVILEPRVLLSGTQAPPPIYTPPDPGPSSSPPGDYPKTDPGLC